MDRKRERTAYGRKSRAAAVLPALLPYFGLNLIGFCEL